jgi:hypothetical protein
MGLAVLEAQVVVLRRRRVSRVEARQYQTDLTRGGVIRGARAVQKASKIPRLVEVDDSANASHLDPVIAPPETNGFTQNVVPFLQSLG